MTLENRAPSAAQSISPAGEGDGQSAILLLDAVRLVTETLAADLGGAAEIIDSGTTLKFALASPRDDRKSPPATYREIPSRADQSICGHSIQTANATISSNLAEEKRFTDQLLLESGVVSALCVPVMAENRQLGALGVFSRQPREFKLDDVWFVENVAELIAAVAMRIKDERLRRENHQGGSAAGSASPGNTSAAPSPATTGGPSAAGADSAAAPGKVGKDLRASPRRSYTCRQKVYPLIANQLPLPDSLYEVQCSDISCGGVSFLLPEKPTFTDWVIALGRPPAVAYFTARAAHVRQIRWEGQMLYKVGCRLVDRVQL